MNNCIVAATVLFRFGSWGPTGGGALLALPVLLGGPNAEAETIYT